MESFDNIYDPEFFRQQGHVVVDRLADILSQAKNQEIPVNKHIDPSERYEAWTKLMESDASVEEVFQAIIDGSIKLYHPHYMGHQISPPAPITAVAGMLADFMNNGMGVYEMGGPSTVIEKKVIEILSAQIGYDSLSDGFLTSGGTLANLTALLTARSHQFEQVWQEGYAGKKLAIMVSEQAHYCVDRAARIMGLGKDGVIKIPVDEKYRIKSELLSTIYKDASAKGLLPFAIVGSACTTSTGSYDDLEGIATFAKSKRIWFHVDGAHGGAAVFSDKYRSLLKGCERANSMIIDCHKMMMTPALTTAVIYRKGHHSYQTFSQQAAYLFEQEDQEWYNLAKRTFECTKLMMGIKFFTLITAHGTEAINDFVTRLYDNARLFYNLIQKRHHIQAACFPEANIICYRFIGHPDYNNANVFIRNKILMHGDFYIVQTNLNGNIYLRNTMMNPFTSEEDMEKLLDQVEELGTAYTA